MLSRSGVQLAFTVRLFVISATCQHSADLINSPTVKASCTPDLDKLLILHTSHDHDTVTHNMFGVCHMFVSPVPASLFRDMLHSIEKSLSIQDAAQTAQLVVSMIGWRVVPCKVGSGLQHDKTSKELLQHLCCKDIT